MVEDAWGKCLPDTLINYRSTSSVTAGHYCQLPFVMDEKVHEYCTRDTWETYRTDETYLTDDKEDDYWCATVANVDEFDQMTSGSGGERGRRAFCTEYHHPPYTGCPETYEPVSM